MTRTYRHDGRLFVLTLGSRGRIDIEPHPGPPYALLRAVAYEVVQKAGIVEVQHMDRTFTVTASRFGTLRYDPNPTSPEQKSLHRAIVRRWLRPGTKEHAMILSSDDTYRAAYLTDGQHETVLTGPEHAGLSDDDLFTEARAEMERAGVEQGEMDLVTGEWRA